MGECPTGWSLSPNKRVQRMAVSWCSKEMARSTADAQHVRWDSGAEIEGARLGHSRAARIAYAIGGFLLAGFGVLLLVPNVSGLWEMAHDQSSGVGSSVPTQLLWFGAWCFTAVGTVIVIAGALVAIVAARPFWPDVSGPDAAEPHRTSAST
jgi:hypothetical protein